MIGDGFDFEKAYDDTKPSDWLAWKELTPEFQNWLKAVAKKFAAHVLREVAEKWSTYHPYGAPYRSRAAPVQTLKNIANELDSPEEEIKELKLEPGKYRLNGQVIEVKE